MTTTDGDSAPAAASPLPRPRLVLSDWTGRLVLAFAVAGVQDEPCEAAREPAERVLAWFNARADRREARTAAGGQLALLDPGPRSYPRLPRLRWRRRSTR